MQLDKYTTTNLSALVTRWLWLSAAFGKLQAFKLVTMSQLNSAIDTDKCSKKRVD